MSAFRVGIVWSVFVVATALPSAGQPRRPITAQDCVTVRNLQVDESSWRSTIKISPDGTRVAYPVRAPNLATNENEIELFMRTLPARPDEAGRRILVGDIYQIRWMPDSRHLTFLKKENNIRVIEELDAANGDHHVFFKAEFDIVEYSIDERGVTVVFAVDTPNESKSGLAEQAIAFGYRVPFQTDSDPRWPKRRLFVAHRTAQSWTTPKPISIRSPLSLQQQTDLTHPGNSDLHPALSPDGKRVLLSYFDFSQQMPDEWRRSGFMQLRNTAGIIQAFKLLVLYDLGTGETSVPLKTPWVASAPIWSSDSQSFVVAARPPINSRLEQEAVKTNALAHSTSTHVFWVQPSSATIEDAVPRLAYPWGGPLLWDSNGDLLVQTSAMDTITRYSRKDGQWHEGVSLHVPTARGVTELATDGHIVIGKFSDAATPPRLYSYRPGDSGVQVFAKLNPQFDDLTLAASQIVHWKTSMGFDASGLLLLPPDYVKGKKYPLVIQTKPFTTGFVCSFGNYPSFAPQPLANVGIMYLGWISTEGSTQHEHDYFPKGYPGYQGPGGVAEAAFAMDLWDSAVKTLDAEGLIDRDRVGIIGFSRTGWYTEFILAHSETPYRAATVADNVQYSVGEYWLQHDAGTIRQYDNVFGGPPYGFTLKNWLDYSVSFNIDKIHAPVLMEEMGNGRAYDNPAAPPLGLASAFEVFTGLNRLKKPVELYYYPNEDHTPEHPQARLATMQRNVDWYRFWLKDEEDPDHAKVDQYARWRDLRKMQEADGQKPGHGPN